METVLSIMVLAAIALVAGAIMLWRKGGARKQIALMLLLALVISLNVGIWTIPDASGEAPLAQRPE